MGIEKIRQQGPQYEDLSDEELAKGVHQKFYSDMSYEDFSAKLGLDAPQPSSPGLGITPAQPIQQQGPSASDTFARADQQIGEIASMEGADKLARAKARRPGMMHELRELDDGKTVVESYPSADAMLQGQGQLRDEAEQTRKDRILQGRVSSVVNGATFGLGDEIYSALGDDFVAERYRDTLQEAREERPLETMGLEIVGGLPTGVGAARAAKTATGGRSLNSGASATAGGALYGAADANGDLNDRIVGGVTGGAASGLFAKGLQGGMSIGGALKRNQPEAENLVAQNEFGVRMTRGQSTGDADQIAFEQAAARGGRGADAQQVLRPFMDDQREAVRGAGNALAGDSFASANEAGAVVSDGLKRRAGDAQAEIDRLYDEARSYGAKMTAEGVEAMPDAIRASLPENVTFTLQSAPEEAARAMPETLRALAAVDRLKASLPEAPQSAPRGQGGGSNPYIGRRSFRTEAGDAPQSPRQPATEAPREGLDFRRIEIARQAINDAVSDAGKPSDRRGAMAVKRAFDAYLDGAVDQALFEGDDAFLEAYKAARGARAEFARNFEANKVFEKLIKEDASPEQTLEYILGATKIAPTERVRKVVPQLKKALGEDSPEWAALQEAAIKRVMAQTDRTYNPKVLRDNLDDLLGGRNQSVAQELFTQEQYARLRRFRGVVNRLIPPEGTVNTSNTAYEVSRALRQEADSLFNTPGSRTLKAMVTKYLPDRDAARARSAVSDSASRARPVSRLPDQLVPVTAIGGNAAMDEAARYVSSSNR